MVGQTWASAEQTQFLQSNLQEYLDINCGSKNYGDFWATLRKNWFQSYPEHEHLFPNKVQEELTDEECRIVGDAINKRMGVGLFFFCDLW